MPKIELHLHLELSMRPSTVGELSGLRSEWDGPYHEGWEHQYYTYRDFAGFMRQLTPRYPVTPEDYARVAAELFEDLALQRVAYAEVNVGLAVNRVGDDRRFWPVMEALETARRAAEGRWPIRIMYIGGIMRTLPPELGDYGTRLAVQARDRGFGIAGIDLHGDETRGPAADFAAAFWRARDAGLGVRAHAGEALGPDSVREAIEVLGVTRIAHGTRSVEDPWLLDRLRRRDVMLDLCPTSNVRTATVPTLAAHPIRRFFELGIPISVSSDDTLPFFTNVDREYRLLHDEFGFGPDDLRSMTLDAAQFAFLPGQERATLITLIDGVYQTASRVAGQVVSQ